MSGIALQDEQIAALCKTYPTLRTWKEADASRITEILGSGPVMQVLAPLLIAAVMEEAEQR